MPAFIVVVIGGIGSFWGAVVGGLLLGTVSGLSNLLDPARLDPRDVRSHGRGAALASPRPHGTEVRAGALSAGAEGPAPLGPLGAAAHGGAVPPVLPAPGRPAPPRLHLPRHRGDDLGDLRARATTCSWGTRACRPSATARSSASVATSWAMTQKWVTGGLVPARLVAAALGTLVLRRGRWPSSSPAGAGIYFSLLTIAFGVMFWFMVFVFDTWTGGEDGLTGINRLARLRRTRSGTTFAFYYFVYGWFVGATVVLWRIVNSAPSGEVIVGHLLGARCLCSGARRRHDAPEQVDGVRAAAASFAWSRWGARRRSLGPGPSPSP